MFIRFLLISLLSFTVIANPDFDIEYELAMDEDQFEDALDSLVAISETVSGHVRKNKSSITETFYPEIWGFQYSTLLTDPMKDAVKSVKVSRIEYARKKYQSLTEEIKDNEEDIKTYTLEMRKVPEDSDSIIDHKDKKYYRKKIEQRKATIEQLKVEREDFLVEVQKGINAAFNSHFTADQVKGIIVTPEGEQFALSAAIIYNYKPLVARVTEIYADAVGQGLNFSNEELADFQGAYLSMMAVIGYAQEQYLLKNRDQYKKLTKFIKKVKKNYEETQAMRQDIQDSICSGFFGRCTKSNQKEIESNSDYKVLTNNLKTTEKTLSVAIAYKNFLDNKYRTIEDFRASIDQRLYILNNTYVTIKNAATLQQLTNEGTLLFDQVNSLTMPDMAIITANLDELEKISSSLNN